MLGTTYPRQSSLFYRMLSAAAFIAILLNLIIPGSVFAAQNPPGSSYIIVFKDTVDPNGEAPGLAKVYGLRPGFIYQHALKGMSAMILPGRLETLRHDPRVAYVEADMESHISAQVVPTGIQRIFEPSNPNIIFDGKDDLRVDVDVAVIDTGVDLQHPDLNVQVGVNCTGRRGCVAGGDDDHYHGTHVAGTIGALDNGIGVVGVAPGARIWPVKVLDSTGKGSTSWIIAGIDWVAAHASTIEVANMSLSGGGFSQAEYDAIQGAVNAGVAFAVAAGNNDLDARNYSPGGFNNVLSVSALADFDGIPGGLAPATCRADLDDTLAEFSNWGTQIDITAPGVCIYSTYPLEKGEYGTISGTSMASPHVAGALALLASRNNPANSTDVYTLYSQVVTAGNKNWTDDSMDGIQEPLLDVHDGSLFNPVMIEGSGGVPPAAPTNLVALTVSSNQIDLTWKDSDSNEQGFRIERCTGVDCSDFAPIGAVGPNTTRYSSTGLMFSISYSYRVQAYSAAGDSGYSNTATAVTMAASPLTAPTFLMADYVNRGVIYLHWQDNAVGEAGYVIEACKGIGCTNFTKIATRLVIDDQPVYDYLIGKLTANTFYSFRVAAFDASGALSGYSNTACANTSSRVTCGN